MLEIAFMRSALEGVAAYYAAKNATDSQLVEMSRILDVVYPLLSRKDEKSLEEIQQSVSYTHLDVYKRQVQLYTIIIQYSNTVCCLEF